MKGTPKRLGDIVDAICFEAGIQNRISPKSINLHKTEAVSILSYMTGLRKKSDMDSKRGGAQDADKC